MFESLTGIQWALVAVSCLLAISEILPFSASIKANGIFQGLIGIAKFVKDKLLPPPPAV